MKEIESEHINPRERDLEIAQQTLGEIFRKYKDRGILSMYLWGSVLRNDYIPQKSDIDSLGIVDDACSLDMQGEINKELKVLAPSLDDFRINLIRLSEIRGANPESRIAKVIPVEMLLMEFSTWKHVAGKEYQISDLSEEPLSAGVALCKNVAVIKSEYLPKIQSEDLSKYKSFLKQVMHACHFSNMLRKVYDPFTYAGLLSESTPENKKLAKLLLDARENGWGELQDKDFDVVISWLDRVDDLLCARKS